MLSSLVVFVCNLCVRLGLLLLFACCCPSPPPCSCYVVCFVVLCLLWIVCVVSSHFLSPCMWLCFVCLIILFMFRCIVQLCLYHQVFVISITYFFGLHFCCVLWLHWCVYCFVRCSYSVLVLIIFLLFVPRSPCCFNVCVMRVMCCFLVFLFFL